MDASISSRREYLNTVVLLLVVFAAVNVSSMIPDFQSKWLIQAVTLLTAKGVYELAIWVLFRIIDSSEFALRLYWGKVYLKGLWSYEYVLNSRRYIGVWDIRQDIHGTSIIGNGLDDEFRLRTIVRNVSPLLEETGGYYFINSRNEMQNENAQVFSKTTLLLDRPRGLFHGVTTMRAITQVYGGPSDKQLHPNVTFHKHEDVESIDELITKLKRTKE